MTFEELVVRNRSYRRFAENERLDVDTLVALVSLARRAPSAMNAQPLKYIVSSGATTNDRIFTTLSWAGALKDWNGPEPGERPAGYIVVLVDTSLNPSAEHDAGIAAQTILLGASERGLGGCMLGSIRRPMLRETLKIPEELEISLVIALGRPVENVTIEDAPAGTSVTYYRTSDQVHHVPKRMIEEIIVARHER